jgi:homoserine trans-succinylase
MLPEDPILDEIRKVRHRISAQFDHDPFKLVEYYMKLQEVVGWSERPRTPTIAMKWLEFATLTPTYQICLCTILASIVLR